MKNINNVEKNIKEKQIKIKNENLEGGVCYTGTSKMVKDKLSTSNIDESHDEPPEERSTSEQVFLFLKGFCLKIHIFMLILRILGVKR